MAPTTEPTGRGHRKKEKSLRAREAEFHISGTGESANIDDSLSFSQAATEMPSDFINRLATAATSDNIDTRTMSLGPQYLKIYEWESPTPTDFLKLTDSRKQWKANVDKQQGDNDRDEELDDWEDKPGREEDYDERYSNMSLRFSVARTFVSRAKRAFRAGRTWQDFELEELAANPRRKALDIENGQKRKRALRECLDNKLRLQVFDEMKVRLCNEIWLQAYSELAGLSTGDKALKPKDSFIDGAAAGQAKGQAQAKGNAQAKSQTVPSNPRDRNPPEGPQGPPVGTSAVILSELGGYGEGDIEPLYISDSEVEEA